MILTDAFWPLFALSSLFGTQSQDQQSGVPSLQDSLKPRFPGHTLYKLNDGNAIPSPAWGTGTATARTGNATELVGQALTAGWRHIDTSLNYRNQNGTGEAIKASGIPRKDLYVTSKYDAFTNTSLTEELHQTLSELQLEYLDLYLIHFPRAAENGGGLKKIWKQMEKAKKDGLVKSIGVSNYDTPELIQELLDVAEILPAVNQIRFSVYDTFELAPAFALGAKHGMLFSAYGELSPITRNPGGPADIVGQQIAKRLSKDAGHEVTYAQVIFDWLRSTGVIAVTTTSNKDRLKEQLVPFADGFPFITAAEARAFELSGLGWQSGLGSA